MTDLMFYGVIVVFATGCITWFAAAVFLLVGIGRGMAWCLRRATARRHRTVTAGRCPVCGGGMETCRCGTAKPGIPHQTGGGR